MTALWVAAAILSVASTAQATADGGLVLVPKLPLLIALIALFVLMVSPLNRLVFNPIFKVLDERDAKITGTRARATRLEKEAEEVLARYESSVQAVREEAELARRSVLEAARGDAVGTTGSARSEAEGEIERARTEIAAALEAARETLRDQSRELARQAASSVLGRSL